MEAYEKIPVSALVGSFNETYLLEDCLKSLQFCEEIILVNLNPKLDLDGLSSKYYATLMIENEDKGYFDAYHSKYIPKLKHDWFILIDPDERIRPELAQDIKKYIENPEPFKSLIRAYLWYYFKGEKLKGGPYQNAIRGRLLFYRPGINITDEVHVGITCKPGYGITEIPFTGKNYNEHYWCNSWKQLKDKHTRYSEGEGKVLYNEGKRFSLIALFHYTIKAFLFALLKQKYYRDGIRGFLFSYYEARYAFLSWRSLYKLQRDLIAEGLYKKPKEVALEIMRYKVHQFIMGSDEIINSYQSTPDLNLKSQIIAQYQKSLFRLVNDALEINAFDVTEEAIQKASFNDEMNVFIKNNILLNRLKLIQNSGSYKFARKIADLIK
jgi:hypothetical protein